MGLALNAEQKELSRIFDIPQQYVIPPYQRPYSWEYDHCFQLYNDLIAAFDGKQDYFIGNIIIAKADNNRDTLEVVDGQQRLITLLLFFKVLHLNQPDFTKLERLIKLEDYKGGYNNTLRIRSDVFEAKDGEDLYEVLGYSMEYAKKRFSEVVDKTGRVTERACKSRFESSLLFFYGWITFFIEKRSDLEDLTIYLLRQVYLLPIELSGATQDKANEKALVIFETINNRGMNLEDADIFKAKLYNKAKNVHEADEFIELWTDFKASCDSLELKIDDTFRYYSHIVRGNQGITSSETNLREFFTNEKFSPFELKKYKEVLNDLFRIIEILELVNQEKVKPTELAKWLQIIDAYTNQYPKYVIVTYLFVNDLQLGKPFISFLESLTRYVYYQGSTTTIKFEIYNMIKQISSGNKLAGYYIPDIQDSYFLYLGRLKKGFALLAFYLDSNLALPTYYVDKIVNLKDRDQLPSDWKDKDLDQEIDRLGNYVILDMPKKNMLFSRKANYFSQSSIEQVKQIFSSGTVTYEKFALRDARLKILLSLFFAGE